MILFMALSELEQYFTKDGTDSLVFHGGKSHRQISVNIYTCVKTVGYNNNLISIEHFNLILRCEG